MRESSDELLPSGWVPLGRYRWLSTLVMLAGLPSALVVWWAGWSVLQFSVLVTDGAAVPVRILVGLAALVLVVAVIVLLQSRHAPRPFANFDRSELRLGKRTVPMSEIVWAQLYVWERKRSRSVRLMFGTASKLQVGFVLVGSRGPALDEDTVRLVAEVLRRSEVAMPVDQYDPKGRFAKTNFPTHLTRDEAVEVVRTPPVLGTDLPIPFTR
ncbi:hypothetical protein ACFDTO_08130 [Microbacteriaceae bacterium 4G12]